ncbi:uncharacterized protein LOC120428402 [Culex pipiens pallens]|uniref:uncharacterized protein LOC120428402 n=1 Tax=Culex pipiens pallens TaxID=42434 RepID=UPI00195472A6|nr:uncharacterized protein LOC120428402 [Culex pipiens pallens]
MDKSSVLQIDKTKRNSLTLEQKVEIIKLLGEQAHTKAHLAKQFGVDRSTIRKIELQKERVLLSVSTICIENCQRKYVSTGKHHELEEVLYYWVRQMKPQQKSVTNAMILDQAKFIADQMIVEESFKFSAKWLRNFKKRFGL